MAAAAWPTDAEDPSTEGRSVPLTLAPRCPCDTAVVDLAARRASARAVVRAVADAPVRHLPAALLDALQGSWGTPEEVLGVAGAPAPVRLAVAR